MQSSPAQRLILAWSLIAVAACLALWLLGPVLMPFVVAAVLAYALNPAVETVQRLAGRRCPRVLAVLLVQALFILALVALVMLLVPVLTSEVARMRAQLPQLLEGLQTLLAPWLQSFGLSAKVDISALKSLLLQALNVSWEDGWTQALTSLRIGGSVALAVIGNLVLIPVVLFYLLLDWRRFVRHIESLVPLPTRPAYDGFVIEADAVLGQYLRGQLSVMLVLAIYYSLALWASGLEQALPIGVFTGLAIFVPYVGFGVGLLLALLAALLQFAPGHALLVVALVYGVGQLIESFVLTPRLVGERIGLHPLHVIFALLAFGQLFGFVGVLAALPMSALLLVAVRRLRTRYQQSRLYRGM